MPSDGKISRGIFFSASHPARTNPSTSTDSERAAQCWLDQIHSICAIRVGALIGSIPSALIKQVGSVARNFGIAKLLPALTSISIKAFHGP